jgi:mono/diheme cytochrome c family protein
MRRASLAAIHLLAFAALAMALMAQDESRPKGTASVYDELEKVSARHRAKENPLARDAQAVAAGGVLFEEHCEGCHGKEAMGGKKAPSLRVAEVQNATPGTLYYILSNGVVRKGMPVWSKLPELERWQLVSYVKSLGVAGARSETAKNP